MLLVKFPRTRVAVATAVSGLTVLGALAATAGPAAAGTKIHASYPVNGSTFIKKTNSSLTLGPGTLKATVDATTGKLTATLTLPDATGSFKEFGIIPVTATVHFINNGPTTGTVNINTGATSTTSKITLQLVKLTVAGLPVPVGNSCESSTPAVVKVKSQKGFNILAGGNLKGTYTIPPFANCELATLLINLTIPGPGNTITLTLGKATIG
jgi:hypothetical protein